MATKIQGITIEIGGDTSPLSQALSSANKSISTTQAELKNVEKALKLNPDSVVLLTQKHKLLEDQIINTAQKVAKLREIEKELKSRRDADKSNENLEKQLRAVQRELLNTENGLGTLKTQYTDTIATAKEYGANLEDNITKHKTFRERLADAWTGLKNLVTGNKDAADSHKKTATETLSAIEIWNKFSGAVENAAKKLFSYVTNAAAKADDLNTLAAKTGLTTEELQKMEYAAAFIDVELETMTGSLSKLTRSMESARNGSSSTHEAFDKLGVKVVDFGGKLRNNNEVFYEVIDRLGKIHNETERDALAMEIFGKSAQELTPLIKAGSEQLRAYGAEAETAGIIMSQDTLDGANRLNDVMDRLRLTLQGVATNALAECAANLADFAEKITPLIVALAQIIGLIAKIPAPVLYIVGIIVMLVTTFANVTKGVGAVKSAIDLMNPAMWKTVGIIMMIITALIALIALIVVLTNKTEDVGKVGEAIGSISDEVGSVNMSAPNIPRYANGTSYHPGGAAFITEFSPEQLMLPNGTNMVVMPRGTKVDPNVSVGAGGGDIFHIGSINVQHIDELEDIAKLAKQARQDRRSR